MTVYAYKISGVRHWVIDLESGSQLIRADLSQDGSSPAIATVVQCNRGWVCADGDSVRAGYVITWEAAITVGGPTNLNVRLILAEGAR